MSAPASASSTPRAALILKTDTLGDLVLFAPTLSALRQAWPNTRLVALIRRSYADLAALLVPGVEWLTTTIDPFAQGPAETTAETTRLREAIVALAPEIVAAATSRRNWLEAALGAAAPTSARRVALGAGEADPFFTVQLRLHAGIEAAAAFPERIEVPATEADWQRNFRLADALLGTAVSRTPPALKVDQDNAVGRDAAAFLAAHGLQPRRYIVCAAAGFANVAIKTWPAEKYAAVLRNVHTRHGLPTLLIGHEGERAHLAPLLAQLQAPNSEVKTPGAQPSAALFLGREGELPLLASLLGQAALFVGNDTGAMHLAAAVDVPVVAVFGGGTWPRFVPAGRRSIAVVQPLPCFGCGWDCAFGDAPCVKEIAPADVTRAIDSALARRQEAFNELLEVEYLPASARALMGAAAQRYHSFQAAHLARQLKIEEKERAIAEKEAEIDALKAVCDERQKLLETVHGHATALTTQVHTLSANHASLQDTLAKLPADAQSAARALHDFAVHTRNLDALLVLRDREIAELKATVSNVTAGLHDLELAKHYGKLLTEKEAAIQSLRLGHAERERVIKEFTASATGTTTLRKLWVAFSAHAREKWWRPFDNWLFRHLVEDYWMQIGVLKHYEPRPLLWDERILSHRLPESNLPQVAVVTPSYGQERFIERTMLSVLDQLYPKLIYVVQDGGSKDRSAEIIARHATRLHHWESVRDKGQADAIRRGFEHIEARLGPDDIMAWLNSDDLIAPGSLRFVAEYFAAHPEVDVIYGHRIIIDDDDRDVGRWIMPRHDPATLEWIDYVPQETMFWRKRAWDAAGGIDPTFQFALDWDLLARFQQAGCRMVRVPYFLGAFRVHPEQKTSQAIHTVGAEEMRRIRTRFHGERQDDFDTINRHARSARFWGAVTARLHEVGLRW